MLYQVPISGTCWSRTEYGTVLSHLLGRAYASRDYRTRLRTRIEQTFGGKALLLNSGRSALEVALLRMRMLAPQREKNTILVPSFLCRAVADKIVRCGFAPRFYDITPGLNPCVESLKQTMQPGVAGVVVPHLYGKVENLVDLAAWCRAREVRLIEDCAAAFLVEDSEGTLSGLNGDYVIFSFQEGKTVVAGSGGALIDRTTVLAADEATGESWSAAEEWRLCLSKLSFLTRKVHRSVGYLLQRTWGELGPSFADRKQQEVRPLAAVDASLVFQQIDLWRQREARKRAITARYARNVGAGSGLSLPQVQGNHHVGRLFVRYPAPILRRFSDSRYESAVVAFLKSKGVQTQLPYYPVHRLPEFQAWREAPLPTTDAVFQSMIEVPTQITLQDDQIDYVCECLRESLNYAGN